MEITTTARRITRTLNAHAPSYRIAFDADGHIVDAVVGPEAFLADTPELRARARYYFCARQRYGQRWTYREIQDAITPLTAEEQQIMAEVWQEMQDEADAWYAEVAR